MDSARHVITRIVHLIPWHSLTWGALFISPDVQAAVRGARCVHPTVGPDVGAAMLGRLARGLR